MLLLIFLSLGTFAQNERFKSLFVYNFTKNIAWPADYQTGDLVITVLGNSPIYPELQKNVEKKQIENQTVQVNQATNLSSIGKCNILYIPAQQSNLLGAAIKQLEGKPTVIVTEKSGLMSHGSDINIIQVDGKLQFEINLKQLNAKKLKASQSLSNLGIAYDGTNRKVPELESVNTISVPR